MAENPTQIKPKPESDSPGWKNPYVLYLFATLILFGILVLAAWLALKNGWIPKP